MNSTPPSASSKTAVVFSAVWPMYWPTRSRRATSLNLPSGSTPSALQQLAVEAGDRRLAGAGRAGEDQVVADRADGQPGLAAPLVDLDLVDQRPHLGLHPGQPDHRVEFGEQLLHPLRVLLERAVGGCRRPPGPAAGGRLDDRRRPRPRRRGCRACAVRSIVQPSITAAAAATDHDADALRVVDASSCGWSGALWCATEMPTSPVLRDLAVLERRAGRPGRCRCRGSRCW